MNNISFQGRTQFIQNPKRYSEISKSVHQASRVLHPGSKHQLFNGMGFILDTNADNLAVAVHGDKTGFVEFVSTAHNQIQNALDTISSKAESLGLKSKNKELSAIILGGDSIHGPNGTNTIDAVNKIADVLEDLKIKFSIFVGSKNPQENFALHGAGDTFEVVWNKPKNIIAENEFDIVERADFN